MTVSRRCGNESGSEAHKMIWMKIFASAWIVSDILLGMLMAGRAKCKNSYDTIKDNEQQEIFLKQMNDSKRNL